MSKDVKWEQIFCPKMTPVTKLPPYLKVEICVKRDELNHEIIQGNKLRKLKYNIKYALEKGFNQVATFGGTHSNHIVATALAANLTGLKSVGFIRGQELEERPQIWSETLIQAKRYGMQFVFIRRQDYRKKIHAEKIKKYLSNLSETPHVIPEGGSNNLALKGIAEIISELKQQIAMPTHIISACGTGGTIAGLIDGVIKNNWRSKVIGIPVLRGAEFLVGDIENLAKFHNRTPWQLYRDYHAGGYAKLDDKTLKFAKKFSAETSISLDRIYTAKSFYAAYDLIKIGEIPANSQVLILHTGGLQGGVV